MSAQRSFPSYQGTGPVVTVYLALSESGTGYGREVGLRWRALRASLLEQGASEADLAPLDERVASTAPRPRTLAAFVRDGRMEAEECEECDVPDLATLGPLPTVVPLLRWRQQWVPYVVAMVDRAGADLAAYRGAGPAVKEETVVGPDDEIERNAPGGWAGLSQTRFKNRAEDSWAHNAAEVADHIVRLVPEVGARLVLVAGDVRAAQELIDRLPEQVRNLVEHVTTGLDQKDQGRVRLQRSTVSTKVHEAAARAREQVLAELETAIGNKHLSAGEEPVSEALRRGAVSRLVVEDRPGDERWAWMWADDPLRIAPSTAPVAEVPGAEKAPLREVLVRAAFGQGADVTVVGADEADAPDGVAALLRY